MSSAVRNVMDSVQSGARTHLRLGARASALSLAQSGLIAQALESCHPGFAVEIVPISTTGDEIQDRPLHEFGGKGLFTKQLEEALLRREVDFAVHSYKDVPVTMPLVEQTNLMIAATPSRGDPRDVLVSMKGATLFEMPRGARVGTGSLRRKAQLLNVRPDFQVELIRGNIDTRLRKLESGEFDGILLASAGLRRAGFFDASYMRPIPVEQMVPAAAQGCLALQCCRDRPEIAALLGTLNDPDTALAVSLEREVIRLLDGDCHSPIGVYAVVSEESITLRACVAKRDGTPPLLTGAIVVDPADPGRGPRALVESLEARGVRGLLGK